MITDSQLVHSPRRNGPMIVGVEHGPVIEWRERRHGLVPYYFDLPENRFKFPRNAKLFRNMVRNSVAGHIPASHLIRLSSIKPLLLESCSAARSSLAQHSETFCGSARFCTQPASVWASSCERLRSDFAGVDATVLSDEPTNGLLAGLEIQRLEIR